MPTKVYASRVPSGSGSFAKPPGGRVDGLAVPRGRPVSTPRHGHTHLHPPVQLAQLGRTDRFRSAETHSERGPEAWLIVYFCAARRRIEPPRRARRRYRCARARACAEREAQGERRASRWRRPILISAGSRIGRVRSVDRFSRLITQPYVQTGALPMARPRPGAAGKPAVPFAAVVFQRPTIPYARNVLDRTGNLVVAFCGEGPHC